MKHPQKTDMPEEDSADNVHVLGMCSCGRAPKRKGQRNCHLCNREANQKYRRRVLKEAGAFQQIVERLRDS